MKRLSAFSSFMAILLSIQLNAQIDGYKVSGQVIDRQTRAAIPYAAVVIVGDTDSGVMTDSLGFFTFDKVRPGIRQFSAIQLGYRTEVTPEYDISPYTPAITIEMDEDPTELAASTVKPSPFLRSVESPVSVKLISIADIENIPGANKDIARTLVLSEHTVKDYVKDIYYTLGVHSRLELAALVNNYRLANRK